jgi:hypothetical protein
VEAVALRHINKPGAEPWADPAVSLELKFRGPKMQAQRVISRAEYYGFSFSIDFHLKQRTTGFSYKVVA